MERHRIVWSYAITVGVYQLVALLALLPWLFSWTGVALAFAGIYVFGNLGISLCYHRLLTHRGLVCPKWLEHGLAILGVCSMQDTPARWVAVHRRHHEQADRQDDPHSPLVNFLLGRMSAGCWCENRDLDRLGIYDRYAKDVLRDPFYRRLERTRCTDIVLSSWASVLRRRVRGWNCWRAAAWRQALRFGASLLVWGVFVRTVLAWHIAWSVNSVAHLWGYRTYEAGGDSRNNWFVALISNGEGWNKNHHADPSIRSAWPWALGNRRGVRDDQAAGGGGAGQASPPAGASQLTGVQSQNAASCQDRQLEAVEV